MKKFAFYLPQFHSIPENDLWWGKGFTEWVNVKKAKPLYPTHKQPVVPLNKNYYNLLDKSVVEWQTKLMNDYCVDGFIYYHYYFNGKKLLEKPAENLLKWKNINQPFFFCWANHSWIRSWEGKKTVLVEQTYGKETDWEKHFQYLLPFFQDNRYEKYNNKPLFVIFQMDFPEMSGIVNYFNRRCHDYGFDGLCVINTVHNLNRRIPKLENDLSDFIFYREPAIGKNIYEHSFKYLPERIMKKFKYKLVSKTQNRTYVPICNGDKLYNCSMKNIDYNDNRVIPGMYFSWDNTPRHAERGYVITEPNEKTLFSFFNKIENSEYIFINAWNEWAEGMILEPTVQNGYKYLEMIKKYEKK